MPIKIIPAIDLASGYYGEINDGTYDLNADLDSSTSLITIDDSLTGNRVHNNVITVGGTVQYAIDLAGDEFVITGNQIYGGTINMANAPAVTATYAENLYSILARGAFNYLSHYKRESGVGRGLETSYRTSHEIVL